MVATTTDGTLANARYALSEVEAREYCHHLARDGAWLASSAPPTCYTPWKGDVSSCISSVPVGCTAHKCVPYCSTSEYLLWARNPSAILFFARLLVLCIVRLVYELRCFVPPPYSHTQIEAPCLGEHTKTANPSQRHQCFPILYRPISSRRLPPIMPFHIRIGHAGYPIQQMQVRSNERLVELTAALGMSVSNCNQAVGRSP